MQSVALYCQIKHPGRRFNRVRPVHNQGGNRMESWGRMEIHGPAIGEVETHQLRQGHPELLWLDFPPCPVLGGHFRKEGRRRGVFPGLGGTPLDNFSTRIVCFRINPFAQWIVQAFF